MAFFVEIAPPKPEKFPILCLNPHPGRIIGPSPRSYPARRKLTAQDARRALKTTLLGPTGPYIMTPLRCPCGREPSRRAALSAPRRLGSIVTESGWPASDKARNRVVVGTLRRINHRPKGKSRQQSPGRYCLDLQSSSRSLSSLSPDGERQRKIKRWMRRSYRPRACLRSLCPFLFGA